MHPIQLCCKPILLHSNNAWDPMHAALQLILKTALFVTAFTPVRYCSPYRSAVNQHSCTAAMLGTLCMLPAPVLLCNPY